MEIVLATANEHKRRELSLILKEHTLLLPGDLGFQYEYDETGLTFADNSFGKAFGLYRLLKGVAEKGVESSRPPEEIAAAGRLLPVIADDSGLAVRALEGRPGVFSARYGEAEEGRTLSDEEKNRRLLGELREVENRSAYYVCSMTLILGENRFVQAQETWEGEIAHTPSSGTTGFGYDPIFYLPERGLCVADIEPEEKNLLSHRGKAAMRIEGALSLM
ncbi:MAG: non-canonical purine NTP pyrophosphatase [Alkalispirochaetaceae bacterium]